MGIFLKQNFIKCIILSINIFLCLSSNSQTDTLKKDMSFDLGITRGWNIDALPLLKVEKTATQREVQVMWPLFKYERDLSAPRRYNRFLPFFISDSTSALRELKIITLYYPSVFRYTLLPERQIRSYRFIDLAPEINFLEISRSQDGMFVQNNAFFFIWHKNDLITGHSHLVIFPLWWQFNSASRTSRSLFPVFTTTFNHKKNTRFTAVTPLFYRYAYKGGAKSVLFPLYYGRTDSLVSSHIVFPVYWQKKKPKYQSLTVFPIFSTGHSPDNLQKHLVITPLFWKSRTANSASVTVFPLYWQQQSGQGKKLLRSDILFPVYWHFSSPYETSHTILPIYFYHKTNRFTTLTVLPFYSKGISSDSLSGHLMITPLLWKLRRPDYSLNTFIPLYWDYRDELTHYRILFPLVWNINRPGKETFAIFPFFSVSHDDYLNRNSFTITPFFRHVKDDKIRSNVLFPVFWDYTRYRISDTARTDVVALVFWYFKSHTRLNRVLFPVIWSLRNSDYRSFTFIPFISEGNSSDGLRKHLVVTPLFWYFKNPESESYSLFPLWWNRKLSDQKHTRYFNVVFPFYWTFRNGDNRSDIIFPFSWRFNFFDQKSYTFFPVFSYGRNEKKQSHYVAVTPVYWHIRNNKGVTGTIFPIVWNTKRYTDEDTIARSIVFPLFWSVKSKEKANTVLFPVLWNLENSTYRSFTFVPLFSVGSSPDGYQRHRVITPLLWYFATENAYRLAILPAFYAARIGEGEDAEISHVLFPVYWRYKDRKTSDLTIFPVVWKRDNDKYHSLSVLPLFSFTHSKDEKYSMLMATPILWRVKNHDQQSLLVLPLYYSRQNRTDRLKVILPLYYARHNKEKDRAVLFPVFWKLKSKQYQSATLIPLYSAGRSADSAASHLVISPLYWKIVRKGKTKSTLIPLFAASHDERGNSSFSMFYFLLRYKNYEQRRTLSFLWPVCEYSADTQYRYFRFTPVLWYKKSPALSYFSVLPFYYQRNDSLSKFYNIFWFVYQHKNIYGVKRSDGFLWKTVYRDRYENNDHEFRVLYFLYTHIDLNGTRERSFFPFYRFTSNTTGEYSRSVGLFFYNAFRKRIPGTHEFYQEQKIFWLIRIRSNIRTLEQKGIVKPGEKLKL